MEAGKRYLIKMAGTHPLVPSQIYEVRCEEVSPSKKHVKIRYVASGRAEWFECEAFLVVEEMKEMEGAKEKDFIWVLTRVARTPKSCE